MRESLSQPNYACITLCQSLAVISLTCCVNSTTDIINCSASNLVRIAYTGVNALPDE